MFEVTMRDSTRELIDGADAYLQEGLLTTFFRQTEGRAVVDCWSTRVASFRTAEVLIIRRLEERQDARELHSVRLERTL
jgi:hypothetical protein